MMTRAQIRNLGIGFGVLLAVLSFAFSTDGLIRWFYGAPLAAAGAVLIAVSWEKRQRGDLR